MPRAMMTRFRCPEETDPSRKCGHRPGVWSGQDHEPHSAASRFVIARIAHAVPRAAASAFAVSGSGPSGIGAQRPVRSAMARPRRSTEPRVRFSQSRYRGWMSNC